MPVPHHPLSDVRNLLKRKMYTINAPALQDARNDFGWGESDILAAIGKLRDMHCYCAGDPHHVIGGAFVDKFRARALHLGEDVYLKYYVNPNNGFLIINSCKKI